MIRSIGLCPPAWPAYNLPGIPTQGVVVPTQWLLVSVTKSGMACYTQLVSGTLSRHTHPCSIPWAFFELINAMGTRGCLSTYQIHASTGLKQQGVCGCRKGPACCVLLSRPSTLQLLAASSYPCKASRLDTLLSTALRSQYELASEHRGKPHSR